jgi:hypothetical protein
MPLFRHQTRNAQEANWYVSISWNTCIALKVTYIYPAPDYLKFSLINAETLCNKLSVVVRYAYHSLGFGNQLAHIGRGVFENIVSVRGKSEWMTGPAMGPHRDLCGRISKMRMEMRTAELIGLPRYSDRVSRQPSLLPRAESCRKGLCSSERMAKGKAKKCSQV